MGAIAATDGAPIGVGPSPQQPLQNEPTNTSTVQPPRTTGGVIFSAQRPKLDAPFTFRELKQFRDENASLLQAFFKQNNVTRPDDKELVSRLIFLIDRKLEFPATAGVAASHLEALVGLFLDPRQFNAAADRVECRQDLDNARQGAWALAKSSFREARPEELFPRELRMI